ncbi:MAG: hypothetical protein P9L89_05870 [Candidatus Celaenobacter polaris]|nr:hypothetical protein [Candidatus Celaenobacter polaris]
MKRNSDPKISGHKLAGDKAAENDAIEFEQKERGFRTLYACWKDLDDRLEGLAGKKTYMFSLEDLCKKIQKFAEDFTLLLEEKPKMRKMRRRPKYTEIELMSRRKRAMSNPTSRVREAMLKDLGEVYFANPKDGYEGNY